MRSDGQDEAKRRKLQLNERALKTGSSHHCTCDIISTRYNHFVSEKKHENRNFSAQSPIFCCMLYFV